MATMKTLNGYGFNATEFNGKTSDNYLKKTDTASNSKKLGGKAPEYYTNPRNLFDNSDFRNPVNQRRQTELTGGWNYGIDRWKVSTTYEQNPNGSILITDNGLSMGYWTDMMQLIPFEQLKSKTLTFAVCTENGVYAYMMTLPESAPPAGSGSTYFGDGIWNDVIVMETVKHDNSDVVMFRFRNARTTNQLVYWAALYEGSYTADTLPPYVPKGYAAELAECKRYFELLNNGSSQFVRAYNSSTIAFAINYAEKRIGPTISVTGSLTKALNVAGVGSNTPTSIQSAYPVGLKSARINAGGTFDTSYTYGIDYNIVKLEINADL